MGQISRKQAYDRLKQRVKEWERMAYGRTYNCGYSAGGINDVWITRAEADQMEQTWKARSAGGYTYTVAHSTSVPGARDFLAKDGYGSKLNYHMRVKG
jgi:hypothetical protein